MGYYGLGPGMRVPDPLTPLEKALRQLPLAQWEATLELIEKLSRNTASQPAEEKFRKVRLANEKIKATIADVPGAIEAMEEMGWVRQRDEEAALVLPKGKNITLHEHVGKILDAKQHYKKEATRAKQAESARVKTMLGEQAAGA